MQEVGAAEPSKLARQPSPETTPAQPNTSSGAKEIVELGEASPPPEVTGEPPPGQAVSGGGKPLPRQAEVSAFYNSNGIQVGVAFLIGANFLTNIMEKQIDPFGTKYELTWSIFDYFYNIAFTLELIINLYSHCFFAFWRDHWNVFDTVVVSIGLINMAEIPLPKPLSLLRMMRAFRIFRLFNRVPSLKKNIQAIVRALPGVLNAFIILTIVMCIYAILGVELFKDVGEDCQERVNGVVIEKYGYETIRKDCIGEEYFGSFSRSLYSFFQCLTGESWSEMIARPVIWFWDEAYLNISCALFFLSYILVSSFILANVVVAVLLDHMTTPNEEADAPEEEAAPAAVPLTERQGSVYRLSIGLQTKLEQLATNTSNMQTEFSSMKLEMTAMKQALGVVEASFLDQEDTSLVKKFIERKLDL